MPWLFFQAEDGIRFHCVTGVQTCALPISRPSNAIRIAFDGRVVGVWILAQCIKRHGLTWQAVAAYHTPIERNPDRGRAYAVAVLDRMRRMNASPSPPAPPPVVEQGRPASQAVAQAPMLVKRFREVASNERIVR